MPRRRQRSSIKITAEITVEVSDDEATTTGKAMEKCTEVLSENFPGKSVVPLNRCQNCPYACEVPGGKSHPKAIMDGAVVSTEKEYIVDTKNGSSSSEMQSKTFPKSEEASSRESEEEEQKGVFRCLECETMKAT